MARSIALVLIVMAFIGVSKAAFSIGEFKSISNDVGVLDDWVKQDPMGGHNETEDFGLAYDVSKLYIVSRRNGTAMMGGIVSTLINGTWGPARGFGEFYDDQFRDELFTLYGRLFILTRGEMFGRIVFDHLFVWDLDSSKWTQVKLDIPDMANVFQKLERGPSRFISIDVPDQNSKVAYVVATDHQMANADSSTTFAMLEVTFDKDAGSNPLNASLKFINRIKSDVGKAVIASAYKDGRLYALVANFAKDAITAKISIDYALDLANNNSKVDGIPLDGASMPEVDITVGKDRIFQAKDMLLILGPHKISQDSSTSTRHVWNLDLAQKKMQDVDAKFPVLVNRIFTVDQVTPRLLTADLKKGAFAAKIDA